MNADMTLPPFPLFQVGDYQFTNESIQGIVLT